MEDRIAKLEAQMSILEAISKKLDTLTELVAKQAVANERLDSHERQLTEIKARMEIVGSQHLQTLTKIHEVALQQAPTKAEAAHNNKLIFWMLGVYASFATVAAAYFIKGN